MRRRRCGQVYPRPRRRLVHRGRAPVLMVMAVLVAAAVTAGLVTGYVVAGGSLAVGLVLAWLGYAVRLARPLPAGPAGPFGPGDGPPPPGGAGVREPRRPLPFAPSGAAQLPPPDEPPLRAVATA